MNFKDALELTMAALADLPAGPPAEEILAVIQAAAWADGYALGEYNGAHQDEYKIPVNPYRSQP